jgi:zinc transporter ZupT
LFSKSEAIKAQFVTAVAAVIGTIIGYQVERNENYENVLLALTSGGFLYIATVSMLPSIANDSSSSFLEIFFQLVLFLLGIGLMIGVLYFEENHGH